MRPPLVLLHGFTQTRQSWRRTAAELGGRFHVLAPDLPGHGQAASRPASFPACAAYVRALAADPPAALSAGVPRDRARRFALCGYSMGGRIALYTALALGERVERLVLVGASPGLADPAERAARRAADEALAARIEAIGVEAFAREWGAQPLFAGQPERVAAAAHADRLRNTPAGLAAALRGLGTGVMEPLWDRLGGLAMPVDARRRRARREVPRDRRADGRGDPRRPPRRRARRRPRRPARAAGGRRPGDWGLTPRSPGDGG